MRKYTRKGTHPYKVLVKLQDPMHTELVVSPSGLAVCVVLDSLV